MVVTQDDSTSLDMITKIPSVASELSVVAFNHRAIVAAILFVFALIGLFGNALVIISVIVSRKLRTITNVLVVNLAFADFMACTYLPFQSAGLLSQTGRYPLHETVCAAVAAVGYISACCSVYTLVAIAFVRWYVITRSIRGHQGLHTPKKIAIMVVIIWIFSISFMIIPPVLGIGTLGYSEYYSICSLTDTNELDDYYVVLQGTLVAIALLLTLVFYIRILWHVLRHNKQFRDKYAVDEDTGSKSTEAHQNKASSSMAAGSRPPMIKAINRKEIEITKNLFMVVCVFMLCFLATVVNFIIPGTSVFTLYSTMILFANSIFNPIIYGLKHPNFQEVFNKILCCRPVG
ncbi:lateral eye opsin-like [Strongylocentrotus purpuratus]|uniref:G-protein coupled receptors family 1 profile domain-containing protein n=1 Tax=Strongylocentrotus purpuratus TaxID=7668 RepID=A0A7M7GIG9_STRPU|nr:lateral eye opsin-like [Strongylocentrotus purpuratus]|eukprot:XP_003729550.1 PREDICTED: lateral eye opsin-like [Strongylocentrotus purpuratus]